MSDEFAWNCPTCPDPSKCTGPLDPAHAYPREPWNCTPEEREKVERESKIRLHYTVDQIKKRRNEK